MLKMYIEANVRMTLFVVDWYWDALGLPPFISFLNVLISKFSKKGKTTKKDYYKQLIFFARLQLSPEIY